MTHKGYLEQLLSNSIQKLNAFVDVLRLEGYNNTLRTNALAEWEAAESVYTAYLNLIQHQQIGPDDAIPEHVRSLPSGACTDHARQSITAGDQYLH